MKVAEIRKKFVDFFVQRHHTLVDSSSLVPLNDPTLMFTNSGMVQFKHVFLGTDTRDYKRAVSVQACLRAGGKHNDLENVGYTARHHTFFEMLGNWSFGDYFKKEAIEWSWELLTKVYNLPAEKLLVTVYAADDEAYAIWHQVIGLPAEKIIRIGDNKGARYASDNFWMMADTGPCGPCTEIFYDHGAEISGGPPGSPDEDGDRFIEIWNLVFMQFDMQPDGSLKKLPAGCVDTGMGIERLAAILQHVHSNYEIDLFQNLISAAAKLTGCQDLTNPSLKVIADHIRAVAFMIVDGITPSNEGRGYVLRRIIRRAVRHGYKLGQVKPFFAKLVAALVTEMGEAYPKLITQQAAISLVIADEEKKFFTTLSNGMHLLETALAGDSKVLAGDVAFKLHDTFGFPLDLSADVCRERGVTVDEIGFARAMQEQKALSRASGNFKMDKALDYTGPATNFIGEHNFNKQGAKVLAIFVDTQAVDKIDIGQTAVIVLDTTPFYAERGGQIGDVGCLTAADTNFVVSDTQRIKTTVWGHYGQLKEGSLAVGDLVNATIDQARREAIMRNHSVTHMMHKALRDVVGTHVIQRGSLVSHERTRFDFSHDKALTAEQIRLVEDQVNREILANTRCTVEEMSLEEAKKTDAIMAFGERYGSVVRVVRIGSSCELCGGTHTERTGDVGMYKIIDEFGIAAGIRRIDAVTGTGALNYTRKLEGAVNQIAVDLKAPKDQLTSKVVNLQENLKSAEKELEAIKQQLAISQGNALLTKTQELGAIKLLVTQVKDIDSKVLREMAVRLKDSLGQAVVVLAIEQESKAQIAVAVAKELSGKIKAGELVNFVANQVGGKGGGKPELAMAGGTEVDKLPAALASVEQWLVDKL